MKETPWYRQHWKLSRLSVYFDNLSILVIHFHAVNHKAGILLVIPTQHNLLNVLLYSHANVMQAITAVQDCQRMCTPVPFDIIMEAENNPAAKRGYSASCPCLPCENPGVTMDCRDWSLVQITSCWRVRHHLRRQRDSQHFELRACIGTWNPKHQPSLGERPDWVGELGSKSRKYRTLLGWSVWVQDRHQEREERVESWGWVGDHVEEVFLNAGEGVMHTDERDLLSPWTTPC